MKNILDVKSENDYQIRQKAILKEAIALYHKMADISRTLPLFSDQEKLKERSADLIYQYLIEELKAQGVNADDLMNNAPEAVTLCVKIHFINEKYSALNINDSGEVINFLNAFHDMGLWQIEILEFLKPETIPVLKITCRTILKEKYTDSMTLTSTYSYIRDEEKQMMDRHKEQYASGDIEGIFKTIASIQRGYLPFHLDDLVVLIFSVVLFKEDEAIIAKTLSLLKDPYAFHQILIFYHPDMQLYQELLKTENSGSTAFALCGLYDRLNEVDVGYSHNVEKCVSEFLRNGDSEQLFCIKDNIDVTKTQIKDTINGFLDIILTETSPSEWINIILGFLRHIFVIHSGEFTGRKRFLKTSLLLSEMILDKTADIVGNATDYYKLIKTKYSQDSNTILFYSGLALRLRSRDINDVIQDMTEYFYKDFLSSCNRDESVTHFGFGYAYQRDYFSGLIALLRIDAEKRKNYDYYIRQMLGQIKSYLSEMRNPYSRPKSISYGRLMNARYYLVVLFELMGGAYEYVNISASEKNDVFCYLDIIIEEIEKIESAKIHQGLLWTALHGMGTLDADFRDYYYKKITSVQQALPILISGEALPIEVESTVLQSIPFHVEALAAVMAQRLYWLIYPNPNATTCLNAVYEAFREVKEEIATAHVFRKEPDKVTTGSVLSFLATREKTFPPFLYTIQFLSFWSYYFKTSGKDEDARVIETLIAIENYAI